MEVTLCSVQVAAGAGAVAGQVGLVSAFCCGRVHRVSLAAIHQTPHDEDGGIVALGNRCDGGEGAGGWGRRQM